MLSMGMRERGPLRGSSVLSEHAEAPVREGGERRRTRAPWRGVVAVLIVSSIIWLISAASALAFSAHGSVEQVYATGLASGAQATLVSKKGATVATQDADALGGVLFRNVTPGGGYRVE